MKKLFLLNLCFLCFLSLNSLAADVTGSVAFEGETFNFELTGQKNWDYDLKRIKEKNQSKVQLFVKSLDQTLIDKIKNIENPFVKTIGITKNAIDNKWLIEFVLKDEDIETFDYLTDQPSKLIIDFYKSEKPVVVEEALPQNKNSKSKSQDKNIKIVKNKPKLPTRLPAEADILVIKEPGGIETSVLGKAGLYDAGDAQFSRFIMRDSDYKEDAVIKSRNNYYLRFPTLESEFTFWNKMKENPPLYEIQTSNTDENKQARLLKKLFDKKRYLVFIQTLEWFKTKYPASKFSEVLSYMTGDAFVALWNAEKIDSLYEQGQNAYREALEKYPDSALAERTSLLTGMLAIDKNDFMSAIRRLQAHIDNPKHNAKISKQYAKLGLSYCYAKINKLENALSFLTEIEKNTQDQLVLSEVAVRKGDFYFYAKKFNESIAAYDEAAKKFTLVSKVFPSAYFNKMEAQFWQSKFLDSHKSGLEFAQNFPAHDFAPYALTRVGELLDIMGADQTRSVGAYLETHFRYGDSPKTIVSRLHLLSAKMKSMRADELEQTLTKMDELTRHSDLQNADQFKVAMISDGFSRRKEYLRAIDILSTFYQRNPTRSDVKQVTQRIVKNINDQLKYLSDKGEYKDLLKTYRQYSDTWLKTYPRIDTEYFLGLSYENAGAFSDAIAKYKNVLAGLTTVRGIELEKEMRVNQYLPSIDGLYLKLAKNSFENSTYQDAYQYLEKIQKPLELSEAEQVQRVQLASRLYEQKGDSSTAIRYLSDLSSLWKGDEKLSLPVQFRLAEMQIQKNNITEAIGAYEKCRSILLNSEKPESENLTKLANSYSHLLIGQNKHDEAISLLSELLKKHGNKFNLNQERYLLGDLYFNKGEIKKAEQAWADLPNEGSNVWRQLSSEKLKQAAWDVNYKKHIKRIPAMSKLEEQK